ncbi:hypothetical protein [Methylobacterium sp. J-077]|uniref:hypothetical protein n=1 Tax=Methylobacterium sp. J-077 TaxID=2836656 RepID=UPI001FB8628F|nr:hypothetical protein [Methylobacterium sp. J-077]MCJ2121427.1 hypothetical protein [Methylobacterium sp. J-077]
MLAKVSRRIPTGIACLHFEPPDDPSARGRTWQAHLAPIFAVGFAPAHIFERSPEMIRQQGIDHILLQFCRRGHGLVETDHAAGSVTEVQCSVAGAVDAASVPIPRVPPEKQGRRPDALHGRDGDPFRRLVHTSSPTPWPAATAWTGARPRRPPSRSQSIPEGDG